MRLGSITAVLLILTAPLLTGIEYFDIPRLIEDQDVRFPVSGATEDSLVVLYQEIIPNAGQEGGSIYLRAKTSTDGRSWGAAQRITDEISYNSENPPMIFSSAFSDDKVFVAIADSAQEISLYQLQISEMRLEHMAAIPTEEFLVAPRLFISAGGGFHLFANRHQDFRIDILHAFSTDGINWSDFNRFSVQEDQTLNFNPGYVHWNGYDVAVYQSLDPSVAGAYQLYLRYSDEESDTWSQPIHLSDFAAGDNQPLGYDNQRPDLRVVDDQIHIAWERRLGNQTRHVFFGRLNDSFRFQDTPEQVSTGFSNTNAPRILLHGGEEALVWLQSRSDGDRIILARRNQFQWQTEIVNRDLSGSASFPLFTSFQDRLHVFWQNRRNERTGLAYLPPDQHVDPPVLQAGNFPAGGRSRQSMISVEISSPEDPSGIDGYSYAWGANPIPFVPTTDDPVMLDRLRLNADVDGRWYLHVRAKDAAGNWSRPATISYERDTSPPPPVEFVDPDRDEDGFLTSNTFSIEWKPSDDPHVVGYSYRYQRIGPAGTEIPDPDTVGISPPSAAINTRDTRFQRVNEDNGLWVLTVAAIDDVGNRSEPAYQFIPLNKYIPVTIVRMVNVQQDAAGRMNLAITGRGFTADGRITRILLEDAETGEVRYQFELENGDFHLVDNRNIGGLTIARPLPGSYRIQLEHSRRGLYTVSRLLEIESSGTVKFGDFTLSYQPEWAIHSPSVRVILSFTSIWFWLLMVFLIILAVFSSRQLIHISAEAGAIRSEAAALLQGEVMKLDLPTKAALAREKRRGTGLRVKFTVFTTLLVTSVVLMVAFTLGSFVLDTQSRTLSQGLQDRVEVLLESIVTGAEGLLPAPEGNIPELNALANQISVMPEARHVTITGRGREDETQFNYIWATNNPELTDDLERGDTVLVDELSDTVSELEERINQDSRAALSDIAQEIDDFTADIVRLALDPSPEAEQQREEIDSVRSELETQLNQRLDEIGGGARSLPEFDPDSLSDDQTNYMFYQPILYRNPNEDIYFRGMVRMNVSTDIILREIMESQNTLIITTAIIAVIAIGLGIAGALLLATIIIIPINRLVRGVEKIRTTEDKRQLKDHSIQVKTKDELHVLAESVNLMTQGLVKAAEASEELTIGKEVQKMFIPLTQKDNKTKLSTGKQETDTYEFFGYYEGAKTVSGDYFTFTQLDPQTFGLIKCDVAGKGVSAALIMVEVATLFLNHFREWNNPNLSGKALLQRRNELRDMELLLMSMNDLLESTALSGRFAALSAGILDTDKHRLTLANAGDNQLHLYRAKTRRTMQYEMPDAPAAGVFPGELIPNGYKSAVYSLDVGDIVLFFTDGLEEAKRILRDQQYVQFFDKNGVGDEEFSIERIHRITETIQSKGVYYLRRQDNPIQDEELKFDFSNIEPTAENTVLGLIAIEKIFRIYPDPQAGPDNRVVIDKVVDDFLQKVFSAYPEYFRYPVDAGGSDDYRQYSHIKEDEQYDDLTLLAVRRKQ